MCIKVRKLIFIEYINNLVTHSTKMADIIKKGVQKLMECPACLQIPQFTPIFQCSSGHIMCKDCHRKGANCPVCNQPMSNERCLLAEQILYQLPARCKFESTGCEIELLDREALSRHQLECPNRPVPCISIFCKKAIQIERLPMHLKEYHKCGGPEPLPHTGTIFVSEQIFKKNLCWCWMTYFCLDGKDLFGLIARTVGGLWYAWVYLSSSRREAPIQYNFILSSNDGQSKIQHQSYCLPVGDFGVDEMAKVAAPAPRLIFDDSAVRSFATKANPEKINVPGDGDLILGYKVEIVGMVKEKNVMSELIQHDNRGGGDNNCQYNGVINEMPQVESKLNMWKI